MNPINTMNSGPMAPDGKFRSNHQYKNKYINKTLNANDSFVRIIEEMADGGIIG